MKRSKFAIVAILITIVAMVAPASAFIGSQNIETKAERMVDIAYDAQDTVMDIVAQLEANTTAHDMLIAADLDEFFYDNVSLCVEEETTLNGTGIGMITVSSNGTAWELLVNASLSLADGDYEDAIEDARDALEIFRDVLRTMNNLLVDAGIETGEIINAQLLQEAIDRSRDRIAQLRAIIDDGHELETDLTEAEGYLNDAQAALEDDNLQDAKDALNEANSIISYVCTELREIAKGLNPGRVQSYLVHAQQYRERFREMFGQAADEEIDIDSVVQALGYANEEEFIAQLQDMIQSAQNIIQNAQNANDVNHAIKLLKDFSKMAKKMDSAIVEEFGHNNGGNGNANGNGLAGNGKGYGNMGGGNSP